ncbi:MAG: pyridoxal phosphate-dependent aminotransferase family protein [Bacteroidota bacterium]
MSTKKFYSKYFLDEGVAIQAGFNPYYPLMSTGLDDPVVIGDREFVDLASNNYLGLANDPRVKAAAKEGIEKYGVSLCATPVASGYSDLFWQAEKALSEFVGLEDTIIFPSCYQANNGLFQQITGPDDMVIVDRDAHSSLLEGIRSADCPYRLFRHNDMDHLKDQLERTRNFENVFVVTESVFSTEGSIAPFGSINTLCRQYGAVPVVDDSHGIGVIGHQGKGILSHFGIDDYEGIYTASLGKALATSGGMVSSKSSLIRYLRFTTSHLIYSTAIPPSSLMALLEVLNIIRQDYKTMSDSLWGYAKRIYEGFKKAGFEMTNSQTPINSICSGGSVETLKLTKWMNEKGILTTPFIYPSVPEKHGRIRLIAGANIKESSIEEVLNIISNFNSVMT